MKHMPAATMTFFGTFRRIPAGFDRPLPKPKLATMDSSRSGRYIRFHSP
ncbi:MAG TPA: hypothetical protein PLM53_11785 [Spirochaetota bacterium]|nr:hypothetical protein [Spirochaetota bacterium]HQF09233.1 hypothetical protein [Spirochaetota bacterium]HQH97774.1 hypothetical protein [Spirochaetota bacterium]HQJ71477.1 hypothetical protein [Spirochaetota bacterium]